MGTKLQEASASNMCKFRWIASGSKDENVEGAQDPIFHIATRIANRIR